MLHKSKLIIGGGPIGLTFAISLVNQSDFVTIIDSPYDFQNDNRVLALSYSSYRSLQEIGCWPSADATAINEVHISHNGLGISNIKAGDVNLDCLGYTVSYKSVLAKLREVALNNPKIDFHFANVQKVIPGTSHAIIEYIENEELKSLTTDLAVVAEGGRIKVEGVNYKNFDYQRTAIVATLEVEDYKPNLAFERFDKFGPLVLLPHGKHYKLVWSLESEMADQIISGNSLAKVLKEQSPFMKRFGDFRIVDKIGSYPLYLQVAKQKLNNHVALIGNSSQTLNPISAQGMNLGIRDAVTLANLLNKSNGSNSQALYDKLRKTDSSFVTGFTHALARFVEQKSSLANHLCGIGIIGLSNCKSLQNKIANSLIFGL